MFTGGAFMEPSTLQFFYDLGIPVANGYGLTEAGTVLTLNDLKPFRADTVGKPLPGVELRVLNPDADGIGEVAAHRQDRDVALSRRSRTDRRDHRGWLAADRRPRPIRLSGQLQLFGRKKNMIVTEGGKNIYPEDIETAFDGIAGEGVLHFRGQLYLAGKDPGQRNAGPGPAIGAGPEGQVQELSECAEAGIVARNRRLPDFKRMSGCVVWGKDFPRTASMKIKRMALAEEIRKTLSRAAVVEL